MWAVNFYLLLASFFLHVFMQLLLLVCLIPIQFSHSHWCADQYWMKAPCSYSSPCQAMIPDLVFLLLISNSFSYTDLLSVSNGSSQQTGLLKNCFNFSCIKQKDLSNLNYPSWLPRLILESQCNFFILHLPKSQLSNSLPLFSYLFEVHCITTAGLHMHLWFKRDSSNLNLMFSIMAYCLGL